jgi:peptidoglycan/xylan/chitin deacetylase (PgdA/CDA1 family)
MRFHMRNALIILMNWLGLVRLLQFIHRRQIVILMIHGVMDDQNGSNWKPLRPQLSRYQFVSLMDAVDMLRGHRPIQPYSLVLTFDDGYRNNLTHALPILRRYHAAATFFLPTSFLNGPRPFWFDRLDYALQHARVDGREVTVGSLTARLDGSSRDALQESFLRFRRAAKEQCMPDHEFLSSMERLAAQLEAESGRMLSHIQDHDDWSAIMTWDQVCGAVDDGITFGSHTVDHIRLGLVESEVARDQLIRSKRDIEMRTGKPCLSLCYPNGSLSDETIRLATECGYVCGLTTEVFLTAIVVTSRDGLNAYAGKWNSLLKHSSANSIFLTWEWISTWLDTVYPDAPLFVIAVENGDGELVAVAPFYRSDLRLLGLVKYRCLRIIGDCQSGAEYGDVIIRSGFEGPALMCIMHELLKHPSAWDCIYMSNLAGWTGAYERIASVCMELDLPRHAWPREFSAVELPDTYDAYLRQFSRNHRHNIRSSVRRLCESHVVDLARCGDQDELPGLLTHLFELHRRHWESAGQAGSFVRRPPMKRFYEAMAPVALRLGWLRLYVLRVDGVPQAAQYGYAYDGTLYALQDGYNPDGLDGIGNILRNFVFGKCIEERLGQYDFLGEFTEHKRRWGAELKSGYDLLIGRRSLKNRLLFWKNISPEGRFIRQGRPANEGCSHG